MRLVSVNVSLPRPVEYRGGQVTTGIFKEPVQGRVLLRRLNLDGDRQADLTVHGGQNKAVYVYPAEHYPVWEQQLGRPLAPGQFGENFTTEGLLEDGVCLGDVFRVGGAVVEVTQPRMPCYKLGIKMQMPQFPKLFLQSGCVGFYLRVLEEGEVGAGDAIERVQGGVQGITIRDLWRLMYFEKDDVEGARRALEVQTLGPEWREPLEERVMYGA
jgi:MOSC domain-containing protein YiiM